MKGKGSPEEKRMTDSTQKASTNRKRKGRGTEEDRKTEEKAKKEERKRKGRGKEEEREERKRKGRGKEEERKRKGREKEAGQNESEDECVFNNAFGFLSFFTLSDQFLLFFAWVSNFSPCAGICAVYIYI